MEDSSLENRSGVRGVLCHLRYCGDIEGQPDLAKAPQLDTDEGAHERATGEFWCGLFGVPSLESQERGFEARRQVTGNEI